MGISRAPRTVKMFDHLLSALSVRSHRENAITLRATAQSKLRKMTKAGCCQRSPQTSLASCHNAQKVIERPRKKTGDWRISWFGKESGRFKRKSESIRQKKGKLNIQPVEDCRWVSASRADYAWTSLLVYKYETLDSQRVDIVSRDTKRWRLLSSMVKGNQKTALASGFHVNNKYFPTGMRTSGTQTALSPTSLQQYVRHKHGFC
jgi:hypothetical protein